MRKKLLALLLAASMLLALAACAGASESGSEAPADTTGETGDSAAGDEGGAAAGDDLTQREAELTLYTYYADSAVGVIDATLPKVKEKFPNVTINIEHRTDSDGAILKTRAAVGELPDIFECTGTLTDIFIESGDILPLKADMDALNYSDMFLPSTFDGKQSADGDYYALTISLPENAMFYYNREVFENLGLEEPKNYDEFKALVQALNDGGIIPLALFAEQKWPGLQIYDLAVVSEEPLGLSGLQDGTTKITDEAYVNAAEKVYELVNMGLIGKGAFNTNASQAFELHKMGQAGLVFNGAWYFSDVKEYGDNIGYFSYNPFADAGQEDAARWHMSGGAPNPGGYAVSANTPDPELAKAVALEFIYQRTISLTEVSQSANMTTLDVQPLEPRAEAYEAWANSIDSFETVSLYEWSLSAPELITVLEDYTEKLYTGTYPPDQFIADLDAAIAGIVG